MKKTAAKKTTIINIDVDNLAQIIRLVDGNHDLGAGALAEAIIDHMPGLPKPDHVEDDPFENGQYPIWKSAVGDISPGIDGEIVTPHRTLSIEEACAVGYRLLAAAEYVENYSNGK